MFGKPVSLFKIFGFEVKIDFSWIILAVLIMWSLARGFSLNITRNFPLQLIGGWVQPVP